MKNFHLAKTLGLLAGLFIFSSASNAALIDHGDFFTDTNTNTSWLDLTVTSGQSLAEINARLDVGGDLHGWQFASKQDYRKLTMFENYLALYPDADSMPTPPVELAATLSLYFLNTPPLAEFVSPEYSTDPIYGFIGMLMDDNNNPNYGYIVKWEYDLFTEMRAPLNQNRVDGAFLVKKQVPESSSIALLLLGLAGLFLRNRSTK